MEVLLRKIEDGGFTPCDGERRLPDRLLAIEFGRHKQSLYQVVTKQPVRIFGGSLSCTQLPPSSKELLAVKFGPVRIILLFRDLEPVGSCCSKMRQTRECSTMLQQEGGLWKRSRCT